MKLCVVLRPAKSATLACVGLLLFVMLIQPGCKRSTAVVGQNGAKATVTQNHDDVEDSYKGENGEEVHYAGGKKAVALPADFPAVLVYPKAMVAKTRTINKDITVTLNTPATRKKVVAYYKAKIGENGWKIKSSVDVPPTSMLECEKDSSELTILIDEKSDGTAVELTLSNKK
jgi:hypothetical protein